MGEVAQDTETNDRAKAEGGGDGEHAGDVAQPSWNWRSATQAAVVNDRRHHAYVEDVEGVQEHQAHEGQ
jgi:hypothetical protein